MENFPIIMDDDELANETLFDINGLSFLDSVPVGEDAVVLHSLTNAEVSSATY